MKKKLIILFVSLFNSLLVNSQTNMFHKIPSTAQWIYATYGVNCSGSPGNLCWYTHYKIEGDTIIGTNQYKKVYSTVLPPVNNNFSYIGAIRQDTVEKKTYVNASCGADTLYYDYNLQTNDTLLNCLLYPPSYKTIITNTDSVQVEGTWRKRMFFTPSIFISSFIDGVGCSTGFFYFDIGGFEYNSELVCFWSDGGEIPCSLYGLNSISELGQTVDFYFYPNPLSTEATIVVDTKEKFTGSIYLISSAGGDNILAEQFYFKSGRNEIKINFDYYPKGLYIIKIYDEQKGQSYFKKVQIIR